MAEVVTTSEAVAATPARGEKIAALDGVQVSTRYPGGVALRFARLKRYREDKSPAEADTIETVRTLLPGGSSA